MLMSAHVLLARRRRLFSNGPLLFTCVVLVCNCIWIYPSYGPISEGEQNSEEAAASSLALSPVRLKTKTRGALDLNERGAAKFMLVQCHRGQFSNRLNCLKLGIALSRALNRVLVIPMFTDVMPMVDVSKYVSLECFRRNSQAITFEEFQEHICHAAGLEARPLTTGVAQPSAANSTVEAIQRGAFCQDGALLQLDTGFSLADYRGYNCWNRREDITNALDVGIQVAGCTHLPPEGGRGAYSLADIRRHFASRQEKVLMFLDLFGVDMMSSREDMADTISEPGQVCGWMPTEAAAAAANTVMQILIPPPEVPLAVATAAADAVTSDLSLGLSAVLDPTTHRTLFMGASELTREPPPVFLRGVRRYAAVHLRRSDWFYYCGGLRHCFYSMAEAALWLNETLEAQQLDTLYVSTNADSREKMMLRRAMGVRVLFWEDALAQLRSWQAEGAAAAAAAAADTVSDEVYSLAVATGEEGVPPSWLLSLPLDDKLMVQMVEKAICMQASLFVSSISSTFSNQIRAFRSGGLEDAEWAIIESKFPDAVVQSAEAEAALSRGSAADSDSISGGAADTPPGVVVVPAREQPVYLCESRPPQLIDERRLPDYHNPQIFLQQMEAFIAPFRDAARWLWHRTSPPGVPPNAAVASAAPSAPQRKPPPPVTLSSILLTPVRALEWLTLVAKDGHAMAAANRFVDMYTGGAMIALLVEGTLAAPPAAMADCVVAAAAEAGAVSLHVALVGMPAVQQALLMQELERRTALRQITRMGGAEQERDSTFTLLWRGDGLSRHAEPALLEELPTFLERVDWYLLAKARVLLGDRRGVLFRQVANARRLFAFDDPRDGACAPSVVAMSSAA